MTDNRYRFAPDTVKRFRRDRRGSIILGVCAGAAEFFSLDPSIVRIVALLLLWFFTLPTLIIYFLLAFLAEMR